MLSHQERKRRQLFWPNHSSQIFCVWLLHKYHLVFCIKETCYWFRRLHILLWRNGNVAYAFEITTCLSADRTRQLGIYIPVAMKNNTSLQTKFCLSESPSMHKGWLDSEQGQQGSAFICIAVASSVGNSCFCFRLSVD